MQLNFFCDWGTMKHRIPQGLILRSLLFVIHANDLPLRINSISEPILFADDIRVIISSRNFEDFSLESNLILSRRIEMVCCQLFSSKFG